MNLQQPTPAQCVTAFYWYMQNQWNEQECRLLFGRDAEHLYPLYERYEIDCASTKWGVADFFFSILEADEQERLMRQALEAWSNQQNK